MFCSAKHRSQSATAGCGIGMHARQVASAVQGQLRGKHAELRHGSCKGMPGLQRDKLLRDAVRQAQDARHSRQLLHHILHFLAEQPHIKGARLEVPNDAVALKAALARNVSSAT